MRDIELKIMQLNHDAHAQRGALSFWIIYDHPSDIPYPFVAIRHEAGNAGVWRMSVTTTHDALGGKTLDELRGVFARIGMTRFERDADDDPKIVEVWMA